MPRPQLEARQRERLVQLLANVLPQNAFFQEKFRQAGLTAGNILELTDLQRLPFTTKAELLAEQEKCPPYGPWLTYPLERYTRLHQTSGTRGHPLRWLDTPESWQWMLGCWRQIFAMVQVGPGDRLMFPFSFGPFLGFWTAFEAASQLGCLCLAGGGLSSGARLRMLLDNQATVVLTTPTYALHLADVARQQGLALGPGTTGYQVRLLIVAGEPGGSIPATRARIEAAWQARVIDHSGMTEIGPMAVECSEHPGGLHILEADYLAEVIDPSSEKPVPPGELGELVVTNLGRTGSPLLRYRTGDLVRVDAKPCPCGRGFLRLEGGILGRTDDMIALRGNNFYPSALEGVIRRFSEVVEYQVEIDAGSALAELRIDIEPVPGQEKNLADRIAQAIRDQLLFRAEVKLVPPGSLPRFEMKAQRIKTV